LLTDPQSFTLRHTVNKMGLLPKDKEFAPNAKIAAQIDAKNQPDGQHNEGQPIRENLDEKTGHQRSKFVTDCAEQHRASLACIEENYERKDLCQPFFEAYKTCRKQEHQKKMEENSRLSGGDGSVGGCVIS
jgi:hypothetical protein